MATTSKTAAPASSAETRDRLVEALNLDLVGPGADHALAGERLYGWVRPSVWYLTGFLIPSGTSLERSSDDDEDEDIDAVPEPGGLAEESSEDRKAAKKGFFPSSMGLSFLVAGETDALSVTVRWGDYEHVEIDDGEHDSAWQRRPQRRELKAPLPRTGSMELDVPDSGGLMLHVQRRTIDAERLDGIPAGTQAVSLFLVNRRKPDGDNPDLAYAFQAEIEVRSEVPFVPRPDLRGARAMDWDDRVADLHYADAPEYAVGHGVSADWEIADGVCGALRTAWIPGADVAKTETVDIPGAELAMEKLGALADGSAVEVALRPLVERYRGWIESKRQELISGSAGARAETATELLRRAGIAADRMERGIHALIDDPDALDAFRVANRAVARAIRQRLPEQFAEKPPTWRAFQLAFILLNVAGLADPRDPDREIVDLLFFPTGGGKTEGYLGLAAFAMVLRRLRNPEDGGRQGAGVSVIMRYTLRLLTLDQLARASGLICALELEREADPGRFGEWRFEIGLWVGKAATPNNMGRQGDRRSDTARSKTRQFKADPARRPAPVPLENCPWCGTGFNAESFELWPNDDQPVELRIACANFECDFSGDRPLPIQAVDEPVYRRLPAFLIATVDKFASLPWVGETGNLLGGAMRFSSAGFHGATEPRVGQPLARPLPSPDLVIQDELHLISGPLGTMAGLYEAAIEALCMRQLDSGTGTRDRAARPKIVASTATARQATDQIQALFARADTRVFPPPGPNRGDSFFARAMSVEQVAGRRYLGITSPGRSPKVLMRRVWLALMGAAQQAYVDAGGKRNERNPADPYMTVLGYFNSLRELGGARRILEEEVQNTVKRYGSRKRLGEQRGLFADRRRIGDVVELTSRVSTDKVAETRQRLECAFHESDRSVDCAIATNMISVGIDIPRLGLMVVLNQPKTHAEYIQATSRVGRDDKRPGLIVTLLNAYKPRDRSHYERFRHYHETFYRSVEVASVTPFSARALDRGFAGAMVGLARHAEERLTPSGGVELIGEVRVELERRLREIFRERVEQQAFWDEAEREERLQSVQSRVVDLLDSWRTIIEYYHENGVRMSYQNYESGFAGRKPLLREMLDTSFDTEDHRKFRANRSLRDVEPEVGLTLRDPRPGAEGRR